MAVLPIWAPTAEQFRPERACEGLSPCCVSQQPLRAQASNDSQGRFAPVHGIDVQTGNAGLQQGRTLTHGKLNAKLRERVLVSFRQGRQAVAQLVRDRGTTEIRQYIHHFDTVHGHDARQDRHINAQGPAAFHKVQKVCIVIEVIGSDILRTLIDLVL